MDEVWVPSRFNVESFAASGVAREKLFVLHQGIDTDVVPAVPGDNPARVCGTCRHADFVFLSVFEWSPRKGGDILLAAFLAEFSAADPVCLCVKTYSSAKGASIQRTTAEIVSRFSAPPRVHFVFEALASEGVQALYAEADAFVLPRCAPPRVSRRMAGCPPEC